MGKETSTFVAGISENTTFLPNSLCRMPSSATTLGVSLIPKLFPSFAYSQRTDWRSNGGHAKKKADTKRGAQELKKCNFA